MVADGAEQVTCALALALQSPPHSAEPLQVNVPVQLGFVKVTLQPPWHCPWHVAEPGVYEHVPEHVPLHSAPAATLQVPVQLPEQVPPEKFPVHVA
jgi:hypothetical protein